MSAGVGGSAGLALAIFGVVLFVGGAGLGYALQDNPCASDGDLVDSRDVHSVAALADAVVRDPGKMDCTLSRAGHDRRSFVAMIDDVHGDPALRSEYATARHAFASRR